MATDKCVFINTRVRLQRLKDMRFFAGWVRELARDQLQLRLSQFTEFEQGDQFSVEIHGTTSIAVFRAQFLGQSHEDAVFTICEEIRYRAPQESVRISTDLPGVILVGGTEFPITVVDISEHGAGLLSQNMIPKGSKLDLRVDTPLGVISCTGEVRYCKKEPNVESVYRVGVQVETTGRVDRARWNRVFEGYSAA